MAGREAVSCLVSAVRIGVFDSGVGGVTVLSPLYALLPQADYVYFADAAWCPYGPRPPKEVRGRVELVVRFLLAQGCQLVVVACNTATASAIAYLRLRYTGVPFVGMEPAVKPAALTTATGVIGVLATRGTFAGQLFQQAVVRYAARVKIVHIADDRLVEFVEHGLYAEPAVRAHLRTITDTMAEANVDRLVLGCTHYPFLATTFRELLQPQVELINPAPAVARQALRVLPSVATTAPLGSRPLSASKLGHLALYSSGDARSLAARLEDYFTMQGQRIPAYELCSFVEI